MRAALERLRCTSSASRHAACSSDRSRRSAQLRHLDEQAAHARAALRLHLGVERLLELVAARLVLRSELLVDLARSSRTSRARRSTRTRSSPRDIAPARCATTRAAPAQAARSCGGSRMTIRSALCPSICTEAVAPASGTASAASPRRPAAECRTALAARRPIPAARGTSGAGRSSLRAIREQTGCAFAECYLSTPDYQFPASRDRLSLGVGDRSS